MRHSDVIAAARVLIGVPQQARAEICARLLEQADWADKHTRKLKKPHPVWGCGTLRGVAASWPQLPEPTFDHAPYRAALIMVLDQLGTRKSDARLVSGADMYT